MHTEKGSSEMTSQDSTEPTTGEHGEASALDRAAAQGPLPEPSGDQEPGGGAAEHVEDSTEEESRSSFLGIHLRP